MGEFNESEEEDQPRTMGLRRALEKQKEEEAALFQYFLLTTLFTQEIEKNKEAWIERVSDHLEKKLEKAYRDLDLQRRMTRHYKKLNQFSLRKLKATQEKQKEAQKRRPTQKMKKDISRLQMFSSASQHAFENS